MAVTTNVDSHAQLPFRIEARETHASVHFPWNEVMKTEIELTGTTGTQANDRLTPSLHRCSAWHINGQRRRRPKTYALPAERVLKPGQPSWSQMNPYETLEKRSWTAIKKAPATAPHPRRALAGPGPE